MAELTSDLRQFDHAIESHHSWPPCRDVIGASRRFDPVADKAWIVLHSLSHDQVSSFLHYYDLGRMTMARKILLGEMEDMHNEQVLQVAYRLARSKYEDTIVGQVNMYAVKKPAVPAKRMKQANTVLHAIGKQYWSEIPLHDIFWALKKNLLIPLQEDGTEWSGLLCGKAECGTEEAKKQYCIFPVATVMPDSLVLLTNHGLYLSWGTIGRTLSKYEIVCYLS